MSTGDLSGYSVVVLREGHLSIEEGMVKKACSVSLVVGPKKILVETGSAWDSQWLIEALRRNGVAPTDLDYVVCTHCRSDHIGNLSLFPNATHIVGPEIQPSSGKGVEYLCHDFADPFEIDNDVRVMATPGHSLSGVSVMVKGTELGTVAITGELFESVADFEDPDLWMRWSHDEDLQLQSRERIVSKANYVVPGHGAMFQVQDKYLHTPSIQEVND